MTLYLSVIKVIKCTWVNANALEFHPVQERVGTFHSGGKLFHGWNFIYCIGESRGSERVVCKVE